MAAKHARQRVACAAKRSRNVLPRRYATANYPRGGISPADNEEAKICPFRPESTRHAERCRRHQSSPVNITTPQRMPIVRIITFDKRRQSRSKP